jgi:ribosomal protein S18 acetylase RimI-like enzyme
METPAIRTANQDDEIAAIDTIVLAFAADPMARWCWPHTQPYLLGMPSFTRAFGGAAFLHGGAHCSEDGAGVGLWLPPNVHPDEETSVKVLDSQVPAANRGDLFAVFEQMAHYHPAEPHWYLPVIGVDPAHQGRGYGGALMKHALEQCDRDHAPAYLESSNPRNISLYQRHGFDALGTIQVGASPPVVPMLRKARLADR